MMPKPISSAGHGKWTGKGHSALSCTFPKTRRQRDGSAVWTSAIGNYFAYRTGMLERDLSDLFRVGRRSLAMGMAVLAVCIGLSQIVRTALPELALGQLLAEGIIIFGWVANWRPAEILLYDIWDVRRRVDLYRRLANAQVDSNRIDRRRPYAAAPLGHHDHYTGCDCHELLRYASEQTDEAEHGDIS